MKHSFITATYNGVEFTREMIKSFEATLPSEIGDFEFIIVDNNSTDGTRDFLGTLKAPPYRIVYNQENLGFAKANNQAAHLASGQILCFLNNDLILTSNWFEPMRAALYACDDVGAVGNIQLNARSGLIDHAGVFFGLNGEICHSRKGKRRIPKKNILEWNAVTAACMLTFRSNFIQVGGFDEAYINGSEDIDFCFKLRGAGYRNYVTTKSVIYHYVHSSEGRKKYNNQNSNIFLQRWKGCTTRLGRNEWPAEYIARYACRFWKYNLKKLSLAIILLFMQKLKISKSHVEFQPKSI